MWEAGLARDGIAAVWLNDRGGPIAGKPACMVRLVGVVGLKASI